MASKKTAVPEVKVVKLHTQGGCDELNSNGCDGGDFSKYINEGQGSPLVYKDTPIYDVDGDFYVVVDGIAKRLSYGGDISQPSDAAPSNAEGYKGALVSWGKTKSRKILILNGDENENELVNSGMNSEFPTISFICAGRFFTPSGANDDSCMDTFAKLIGDGDIELIDFTMDTRKKMTAEEKKQYNAWLKDNKKNKPPVGEPGFSPVGDDSWHRAGSVLLRDVRKASGKSILLGVDENAYFGVELPAHPDDVSSAYLDLIPEQAQHIPGVVRQGEWFAVPVDESDVPKVTEFIGLIDDKDENGSSFSLPIDDPESNRHYLSCTDGGIGKNGVIYAKNFKLVHSSDDHADVEGASDQWYTFYRNTAVRSFSVEGVD